MKNKKSIIGKILIHTVLCMWAVTTIFPFVWVMINAFKPKGEIVLNSFSIPFHNFTFENFKNAFEQDYNIVYSYGNSLMISLSVVLIVLLIAGFASFTMARFEFKGKKIVYGIMIACMMFPIFSTIVPLYNMLVKTHLNDTRIGVILPQVAGNVGFATIILTGFMQQLPLEVEESAYIDGANVFQIFFRLVVPMAKPAFASCGIFVFLWSYNDLFLQLRIIKDRGKMPITVLLNEISSKYGTDFGLMCAVVAMISVPVLIVYFIFQRNIIKGLTAGAVKG